MQVTSSQSIPDSVPATSFPGAFPRQEIQALKRLDSRIELRWSPRHECWEVWHERHFGNPYVFYRHTSLSGGFLPADQDLVETVKDRAMWTEHGQKKLRQMRDNTSSQSQYLKDPEKPLWKKGEKLYF
jgi:hypothetical protein